MHVAQAQTTARLQHSDAKDSYTEDGYGERTYTINAKTEKAAAAKAVAEYRATHPAQIQFGKRGDTVTVDANSEQEAAAKAVGVVAKDRKPACWPHCGHTQQQGSLNPVQVNAKLVFPPADAQKLAGEKPCIPTETGCEAAPTPQEVYSEQVPSRLPDKEDLLLGCRGSLGLYRSLYLT